LNGEHRFKTDAAFEAMGTVDELCSFVGVVHAHLVATTTTTATVTATTTNANDANANGSNISKEASLLYAELPEWLLEIMSRLFDIGSQVATPPPSRRSASRSNSFTITFSSEHTLRLEEWVDRMTEVLPELNSFILPTGAVTAAHLHVARCVCRRAERRVVALQQQQQEDAEADDEDDEAIAERDQHMQRYLNRLSDFFFTAARFVNYCEGQASEIHYRREYHGSIGIISKQRQRVTAPLATASTDK
jgi:ATP:cob(I)alamin adenosyltransferase